MPLTLAPEDLILVGLFDVPAAAIAFVLVRRGDAPRVGSIIMVTLLVLAWWAFTWTPGVGEEWTRPPPGVRAVDAALKKFRYRLGGRASHSLPTCG